jgi:hypothetical protein
MKKMDSWRVYHLRTDLWKPATEVLSLQESSSYATGHLEAEMCGCLGHSAVAVSAYSQHATLKNFLIPSTTLYSSKYPDQPL